MKAQSLRALLTNLVDYAGLYAPAALPRLAGNVDAEPAGCRRWKGLREVRLGETWRVTLLVDGEPGPLPPQVETLVAGDSITRTCRGVPEHCGDATFAVQGYRRANWASAAG